MQATQKYRQKPEVRAVQGIKYWHARRALLVSALVIYSKLKWAR